MMAKAPILRISSSVPAKRTMSWSAKRMQKAAMMRPPQKATLLEKR